jgi:hypothetical protein
MKVVDPFKTEEAFRKGVSPEEYMEELYKSEYPEKQ